MFLFQQILLIVIVILKMSSVKLGYSLAGIKSSSVLNTLLCLHRLHVTLLKKLIWIEKPFIQNGLKWLYKNCQSQRKKFIGTPNDAKCLQDKFFLVPNVIEDIVLKCL